MVRCVASYLTKDSADTRRAIHLEDSVAATRRESWNKWDVIASVGVLGLVLAVYLYFSFWLK